ncbi:IgE-binding protein [Diplocarpon rosae]|nr:IgE-binding protein [Diplocarpon rosae]
MIFSRTLLLGLSFLLTGTIAQISTLTAYLPDSVLNGQKINAAGQAFYLGLDVPATYCPTVVEPNCPVASETVVGGAIGSLWVNVPGGQQIYVRANGALAFVQAHSNNVPEDSYRGGFLSVTISSDCAEDVNVFTWKAPDGSTACPDFPVYQIYARTQAFNRTDCVELEGLQPTYKPSGSPFGAWEYT